ncbi:M1 family metallopeptidase [Fodinibius halophilus]|uniref:M1 family metallopeptidase n=1 Tax=Fodinibius halophilus TaxID=1736908 RepID=A0A6M1T0W7_9BACT|nr:M1 family metallopeptidase [Fodinibius halophilus]NGP87587.1 M1 family metallopeptidase [Fodinibius halophilus]
MTKLVSLRNISVAIITLLIFLSSCTGTQQVAEGPQQEDSKQSAQKEKYHKLPSEMDRPVANPITNEIPTSFFNAVELGTRTMSGEPGPDYWTQRAHYDIDAELIPSDTLLKGSSTITYYNNSPDTLGTLFMELAQNLHKKGVQRSGNQEVTGGVTLHKVAANDKDLSQLPSPNAPSGYYVNGTQMVVRPNQPLAPGDSMTISVDWDFKIPQAGADGRMGYSKDNLYYIAYWYPQMRVYDDVNGWFTDPFTGNAEFYHDFANYNVDITVPEQWMVGATGKLRNSKSILTQNIHQRLSRAHKSDSVIHVVTKEDFGSVTKSTDNNKVTWNFQAQDVRDFAFSVTKESLWDATRASVGDRDGDGNEDFSSINAIYRNSAPLWTNAAKFTRNAITFLSEYTHMPYPWPHMTSVEGGGIIGGGMEFPMITIIGDYKGRPAQSLYAVIAHELAHMWVPMQISTNERRYAWMDEGTTTFNENQAKKSYYPDKQNFDISDMQSYLRITYSDAEGPIMRWSDYHYNGFAYGVASYPKPATMLVSLRNYLGEETFNKAYRTFLDRWQYKHPYPWDMFNTFEDVAGQDLDWFWRSWYYETWTLDHAVAEVTTDENSSRIIIHDNGLAPMPANIEITLADGSTIMRKVPVEKWLKGATKAIVTVDGQATKVVIDPDKLYPDNNRENNRWTK